MCILILADRKVRAHRLAGSFPAVSVFEDISIRADIDFETVQ